MNRNNYILKLLWITFHFLFLFIGFSFSASAIEKRVALVIGNSNYQNVHSLPNPKNDAIEIGSVLERIGFDVEVIVNANKIEMDQSLRHFGNKLDGSNVALFFYAGHGIQVDGSNYILPIDAALKNDRDLTWEACDLGIVIKQMDGPNRVNLIFLDACRDNPLSRTIARTMGKSRSTLIGRGLAPMNANTGTLISFATKDGEVAADGNGMHSPYCEALLKYIEVPHLEIGLMLRKIREEVIAKTENKQVPWEYGSLLGEFYFTGSEKRQVDNKSNEGLKIEALYWESIMKENDPEVFQDYLTKYPNGTFKELAEKKLYSLNRAVAKPYQSNIKQSDQAKPTGKLKVTSNPPGASIYLNNKYMGITPKELEGIPVGTYKLVLKKDEFDEWEDTVTVKASNTQAVTDKNNNSESIKNNAKLSVSTTQSEFIVGDQNHINTSSKPQVAAQDDTLSKTDRSGQNNSNKSANNKISLTAYQKIDNDSDFKPVWSEVKTENEVYYGMRFPIGTHILYTPVGSGIKIVIGYDDDKVTGWNACGKPAVWIRNGIEGPEYQTAVNFAVLRDKAEQVGFYFNLSNNWRDIFHRYTYPNTTKRLKIEPGISYKDALANIKCNE